MPPAPPLEFAELPPLPPSALTEAPCTTLRMTPSRTMAPPDPPPPPPPLLQLLTAPRPPVASRLPDIASAPAAEIWNAPPPAPPVTRLLQLPPPLHPPKSGVSVSTPRAAPPTALLSPPSP